MYGKQTLFAGISNHPHIQENCRQEEETDIINSWWKHFSYYILQTCVNQAFKRGGSLPLFFNGHCVESHHNSSISPLPLAMFANDVQILWPELAMRLYRRPWRPFMQRRCSGRERQYAGLKTICISCSTLSHCGCFLLYTMAISEEWRRNFL